MSAAVGNTKKTSQRVQKGSRRADCDKVDGKPALILLPFHLPLTLDIKVAAAAVGKGLSLISFSLIQGEQQTQLAGFRVSISVLSLLLSFLSNLFSYILPSASISLLTETLLKPIF